MRLAEVVGLALRSSGDGTVNLNLMPQELVEEREFAKKQGWLVAALALVLASVGLWAFYHKHAADKNTAQQAKLELDLSDKKTALQQITGKQEEQEKIEKKIEKIQEVDARRDRWLRTLAAVREQIRPGVWITGVSSITGPLPKPAPPADAKEGEGAAPGPIFDVPQPYPVNTGREGADGFNLQVPEGYGVLKLHVQGLAYTDVVKEGEDVDKFLLQLRQTKDPKTGKPLFKGSERERRPIVGRDDEAHSFETTLILEEPIAL